MVKTSDEILQQVKTILHRFADRYDWSKHHSFGLDNHPGLNDPEGIYQTGFNDGLMSMAHDTLVQICTANASMK